MEKKTKEKVEETCQNVEGSTALAMCRRPRPASLFGQTGGDKGIRITQAPASPTRVGFALVARGEGGNESSEP